MSMNQWLSLVVRFAPLVLMVIPGMPAVLVPVIVHAIQEAEQTAASGTDKKAHALAVVTDAITAVNTVKGKPVINPEIVQTVVSPGIDTAVGVVNLVSKSTPKVTTQDTVVWSTKPPTP